jgi:hypothetical protein
MVSVSIRVHQRLALAALPHHLQNPTTPRPDPPATLGRRPGE